MTTVHRLCVYSGFGCIVLFLIGFWVVAGFIPPPSPTDSAEQTAAFFRDNQMQIRVGLLITAFAAGLLGPWVAAVSVEMREIEGRRSPLAFLQLGFGTLFVIEFLFPIFWWQTATFRTERSAESIQTLNDMAWIPFEGMTMTAVFECIAIGVAVLYDRRANPTFPRWIGYFNFWVALAFAGGSFNMFVKTGPLAWPGLLAIWIPMTAFGSWLVVMSIMMLRRPHRAEASESVDLPDPGDALEHAPSNAALAAEIAELRKELAVRRS